MYSGRPDYSYYRIITREARFISPDFSCVREQNWPSGKENSGRRGGGGGGGLAVLVVRASVAREKGTENGGVPVVLAEIC